MADFNVYPALQAQAPDILGSYLKGAGGAQALQMGGMDIAAKRLEMPYLPERFAQEAEMRKLNMEQLRLAMAFQGAKLGALQDMTQAIEGSQETGQGSPAMGRTGGMQQGPQDATGGATSAPAPASTYGGGGYSGGGVPAGAQLLVPDINQRGLQMPRPLPDLSPYAMFLPEEVKAAQSSHEAQMKDVLERRKLAAAPMIAAYDDVLSAQDPGMMINNNPAYRQMWQRTGYQEDPARLSPQAVKERVAQVKDQLLAFSGQAAQGVPEMWKPLPGGYQQMSTKTGETKGSGGIQPQLNMLDYKSATGETGKRPVWTAYGGNYAGGGGGAPGGGISPIVRRAAGHGGPPAAGSAPTPTAAPPPAGLPPGVISTGVEVNQDMRANADSAKQAFDASRALQKRETKEGTYLPVQARVAFLNKISDAGSGIVSAVAGAIGSEASKEGIYAYLTTPAQRAYFRDMIPLLEARAKDLSTRAVAGMSNEQIKLAFEELIPTGPGEADSVNRNRENLAHGLAMQAGPALQAYPDVASWYSQRQNQARSDQAARDTAPPSRADVLAEIARRKAAGVWKGSQR